MLIKNKDIVGFCGIDTWSVWRSRGGRVRKVCLLHVTKKGSSKSLGICSHFQLRFGPVAFAQSVSHKDITGD